jgi:hypothetical protein
MRERGLTVLVTFVLASCGGDGGGARDAGEEDTVDVTDTAGDGAVDATGDDAAPTGCSSDAECDDGDPCTADTCSDYGECEHGSVDEDEDGYAPQSVDGRDCGGTDCDDDDAAVHPDAELDCTGGGDFDCDGQPDADEDADGYVTEECGGDDCDDDDAQAFPGSLHLECTTDDKDCNGEDDGDGDPRPGCGGDDCDDEDPLRSSLVEEDTCDGLDTDCDGSLSPVEDVDRDGFAREACVAEGLEADCDDDDAGVYPGADTTCDMVDDDCSGTWRDESGADDDDDTVLDEACGGDDCDDEDPTTYLGATEICANWHDEDCDGASDSLTAMTSNVRLTTAVGESENCSVAWSGSELGVVWHDGRDGNLEIYFARVSPDGTMVGSEVRLTEADLESWEPGIAWSGSEYGVTWGDVRDVNYEIYFNRVSPTGVKQGTDVRVTNAIWYSLAPSVAWSGSEYGLTWVDSRTGDNEIFFVRMSAGGEKRGSDLQVTTSSGDSTVPTIAWSGSEYGLAWYDDRDGDMEIFFARISAGGTKLTTDVQVTEYMRSSETPSIAWSGTEWGIAWSESRDLNPEIYFVRLSGDGVEVGPETRLTFDSGDSTLPALAWTGSGYVVAWQDDRDGNGETYVVGFSATGLKSGADVRVTDAGGDSTYPAVTWTGSEVGLFWHDARDGNFEIYHDRIGYCE